MGKAESLIITNCILRNKELPEQIQNAPELFDGLEIYWNAFGDLTTCRSIGFGVGPIPWTAIRDYADEYQFVGEQRILLFRHIRAMDMAYLDYNKPKETPVGNVKKSSRFR